MSKLPDAKVPEKTSKPNGSAAAVNGHTDPHKCRLVDVYDKWGKPLPEAVAFLWAQLHMRDSRMNISHRRIPTWDSHCAFVAKKPYMWWWLIKDIDDNIVGQAYLTHLNEIGMQLLPVHQGNGIGGVVVNMIMSRVKSDYVLANINPSNIASIKLFTGLGFEHIQNTYRLFL